MTTAPTTSLLSANSKKKKDVNFHWEDDNNDKVPEPSLKAIGVIGNGAFGK